MYYNNKLCGVCTFLKNTNPKISESNQYQLRGMAVLNKFQGKGLGKILLNHAETTLNKQEVEVIWCNAREIATSFYFKNGYTIIGEAFEINGVGTHYQMYKLI